MTRTLHHAAFAAALLTLVWVGAGYLPGNPLALALVALIGAFFLMGALELRRFRQATDGLTQALADTALPPTDLAAWVAPLHPSLQTAVRLRVEGERVPLPGPALTPYLAGLLVLLGMLGTFLGMVATLKGTGLALENAADVEAIRASLAAPVKGLGLAFGCSVAGVAASAMLGLMSALARRDRLRASRQLDQHIATSLRGFSQAHRQEESLRLLRAQTEALTHGLPALVNQLQGAVTHLAGQLVAQGQNLQDRLEANQSRFHAETSRAYTALADSVGGALQTSLADSARLAGAAIEPAVQSTMAALTRETAALRETLGAAVDRQLDGVTARLDTTSNALAARWQAALAEQQRQGEAVTQGLQRGLERFAETFDQRSARLLDGVAATQAVQAGEAAARERERMDALHAALAAMTATLQRQAEADARGAAAHQQQFCSTLEHTAQTLTAQAEAQARATLGEIARLVQAAGEAPRAAAEVIGELRQALSDSLVRDNAVLDERNRLLGTLGGLLDAVNHASTDQRAAIDGLVQATADVLERAGARFAVTVDAESRTLQTVAAQVSSGAAEVASLGEGFGVAVQLFGRTTEQLSAQLQRIEAALGQSLARSDEQLAYYVAQAREIIDLTLGSQKQIVDDLQQLARAPGASGVRAGAA